MKKKLISRGLLGFPLGMTMGFAITVGISLWIGDGAYYPAVPELIHAMGTELNAVMCQSLLCGVLGSGFGMASLIWTIDSWSLAKQSGVYFSIVCAIMLPIAYAALDGAFPKRGSRLFRPVHARFSPPSGLPSIGPGGFASSA